MMNIEIYDAGFQTLFPDNAVLEELFDQAIWAEGPVWLPKENAVIFSDVKGNCMYKWKANQGITIFRSPSDFANGNAVLPDGSLVTCQHGSRSISHTDLNGTINTLTTTFDGKRLNSPNDLVVKSDGSIWFTDPPYGILSNHEGYQAPSEIVGCYIYCYYPEDNKTYLATFNTMRPNGLFFSPDEKTLYVADMSSVEFSQQGLHHLVAFDVVGHQLQNRRTICEITPGIPDGFCLDKNELIYCSCEDGVLVITPQGKYIAKIHIGKTVSNCTLGGVHQNELYITAKNSLYRLTLNTHGFQYDYCFSKN